MIDNIIKLFATDDPERHALGLELLKGQGLSFIEMFHLRPLFVKDTHEYTNAFGACYNDQDLRYFVHLNKIYNPNKVSGGKEFYLQNSRLSIDSFFGIHAWVKPHIEDSLYMDYNDEWTLDDFNREFDIFLTNEVFPILAI